MQAVSNTGIRVRGLQHVVVHVARSSAASPRVGFVVPKRARTSVDRNLVKRRLRELTRLYLLPVLATLPPADVVIRALPSAYDQSFDGLLAQVTRAAQRIPALVCATS